MRHDIEHLLYQAVDRARHHVYLENYTFCDSLLIYKLAQARRRGVDVRVVLTFSDCTEALNLANRVIANRLRGAGVRVYVYPGMTHAKAAVVDGGWAYLGTGNFDPLSLRRNLELGVALGESPVVAELERVLFAQDFRPEWELQEPLPLTWADYASELLASFCL
jgi:cardiolipin synthase